MVSLKLVLHPLPLALCIFIATAAYCDPEREIEVGKLIVEAESAASNVDDELGSNALLKLLSKFSSKAVSRFFGNAMNKKLTNGVLLKAYAKLYKCNLDEMYPPNLKNYTSIAQFFQRKLKPGVRPVAQGADLVWPADSKITAFGEMTENGRLDQIKGVDYSLKDFFGDLSSKYFDDAAIKRRAETKRVFYSTVYLAPGDYHHFHSPADWQVSIRRHIAGKLYSVNPAVVKTNPGLFNTNERVILLGNWTYGLFSMTAVAAQNVGGVVLDFDEDLHTNLRKNKNGELFDRELNVNLVKGQHVGGFQFGSTIVLVFEAPAKFKFAAQLNDHTNYGKALGTTV